MNWTSSSTLNKISAKSLVSIPNELKEVLTKLYFLSLIEKGLKINTNKKLSFVDSESWLGSLTRTLGNENRRGTLSFIDNIVSITIDSLQKYSDTDFLPIIIKSLKDARTGIVNIIYTYRFDPDFCSSARVVLNNIDIQLKKNIHIFSMEEEKSEYRENSISDPYTENNQENTN